MRKCLGVLAALLLPVLGGAEQPHWSSVIWQQNGNIVTADFDGSNFEVLIDDSVQVYHPRVSPDGTNLAFRRNPGDPAAYQLCVWSDAGTRCVTTPWYTYAYTWSADSRWIYYVKNQGDGQVWRIDFDAAHPSPELFYDPPVYRSLGVTFNHDGSKLYMIHDPHNWTYDNFVEVYDMATGTAHTIYPNDGRRDAFNMYSPTRDEIVWLHGTRGGCCYDPMDLWVMDSNGQNAVNLTNTWDVDEELPIWSPDGEQIYFLIGTVLHRMSRDGSSVEALFDLASTDMFFIAEPLSENRNTPPIADAGFDQQLAANAQCMADVVLDGSGSFDPDGDALAYTWESDAFDTLWGVTQTVTLPPGYYTAVLTVDDGFETDNDDVFIAVEDQSPPDATATAEPDVLWAPNHKMVSVALAALGADNCSPQGSACSIVSVTSNEPPDGREPDWVITGPLSVDLRAERDGTGTDRVYTLTIECRDAAGNVGSSTVTVTVPHDQGN